MKLISLLLLLLFSCSLTLSSQNYFFHGEKAEGNIYRSDLDGGNSEVIVSNQGILRRMRIDFEEEKLFWVEGQTGKMWKSNFDGTNQEVIIDLPTGDLNVIEIDEGNQRIFYTITNDGFIRSINLDGCDPIIVVSGVGTVQGMEYDPFCDKIYWTEFNDGKVKRANGDGSNIETIIDTDSKPFDLAIDIESGKLFFTDRESSDIIRANLDGSALEAIVSQFGDKGAVTIDYTNERLYWMNNTQQIIYSSDLDGTNITSIITGNPATSILGGVVVYVPFVENYVTPVFQLPEDTTFCIESESSITLNIFQDSFVRQEWQDGTTLPSLEVMNSGTYWVNAITAAGCVASDTIEITLFENPELILEDNITICEEGSVDLSLDPGFTSIIWQDTASNSNYTINESGTYWVSAVSLEGCLLYDTVSVIILSTTDDILGADLIICEGASTIIGQEIVGAEYLWQDNSSEPFFEVRDTGIYWVEIFTDAECSLLDSIDISFWPKPAIDLGADTTICEGDQITLDALASSATYLWQDSSSLPYLIVDEAGLYNVGVEQNGCVYTDSVQVETIDCTICNIYIPNVFSPNADGMNDTFGPSSNCDFTRYDLQIYNRWGALVFQSLEVRNTWDGSFKGEYFTPDVFAYTLEFSFSNGQDNSTKRISGDVTILK